MYNKLITSTLLLTSLMGAYYSTALAAPPPSSVIKYLTIHTSEGMNQANIYANGIMQAAMTITYELEKGYTIDRAEVRSWGDRPLIGWSASDTKNEYANEIFLHSYDQITAAPISDTNVRQTIDKFISTPQAQNQKVCVSLTVKKGTEKVSISTCDMNENQAGAFVVINARPEKHYTYTDFNVRDDKDNTLRPMKSVRTGMPYVAENISLEPRGFILHDLFVNDDRVEGVDADLTFSRTVGVSRYKIKKDRGYNGWSEFMDSRLDIFPLNTRNTKRVHELFILDNPMDTIYSYPIVSNNSINFLIVYGMSERIVDSRSAWRGTFAIGVNAPDEAIIDPTENRIIFHDIYGNEGSFRIKRDEAWGVSELGYQMY